MSADRDRLEALLEQAEAMLAAVPKDVGEAMDREAEAKILLVGVEADKAAMQTQICEANRRIRELEAECEESE